MPNIKLYITFDSIKRNKNHRNKDKTLLVLNPSPNAVCMLHHWPLNARIFTRALGPDRRPASTLARAHIRARYPGNGLLTNEKREKCYVTAIFHIPVPPGRDVVCSRACRVSAIEKER